MNHEAPSPVTDQTPLLTRNEDPVRDLRDAYRRPVLLFAFTIIFLLEVAISLFQPAATAVQEINICHAEYPHLAPGGNHVECRSTQVQGRLAMLQGWQLMAECFPAIICAIPYGILADKWGRRPIVALSLGGYAFYITYVLVVLYFPNIFVPEAVIIGPVFALIGGSVTVATAMAYTMIADVVPAEDRATIFFQFGATSAVAELVSNPLAGAIMLKSNWLCILVAFAIWILATLLCFALPETLDIRKLADKQKQSQDHTHSNHTDQRFIDSNINEGGRKAATIGTKLSRTARQTTTQLRTFYAENKGLITLMLSLVFVVLSRVVQLLLLQYTTHKFSWSWAESTFLLTLRSFTNLATSLFILPAVSKLLTSKFRVPSLLKDSLIARATGIFGIIGALIIALAPNPLILSAGLVSFGLAGGLSVAVRSLLNALIQPHHVGMLNTILGFLEQLGLVVAGPLFSKLLKTGIHMGGQWIGLPFLMAAVYMAIATVIVFLFKVPQEDEWSEESSADA